MSRSPSELVTGLRATLGNRARIVTEQLIGLLYADKESYLMQAPDWRPAFSSLAGFVSHGEFDDKLPLAWAEKAERWLNELGVPHQLQRYPAGHQLTAAMVQDFCHWLAARWLH